MQATKALWLCGNTLCSHRSSKRWHREMAERIEDSIGPRGVHDFEGAHPDPELMECDDCYRTPAQGHDWAVAH